MPTLLPIFLIVLVDVFGMTLLFPLLPIYAEKLGASPLGATLLVSVFSVCMLVSGPLLGRISDRTGRKKMLLVSQVGTFMGFILMAHARTLWVLYVARIIDGLTAGNLSLAQAWIADHTAPEDRTKSFALIGIAFGVGFTVGPAVSGWLSSYATEAPIYLAAAMSATSVLCTLFLLPNDTPAGAPPQNRGPGGSRIGILSWHLYAEFFRRPVMGGLLAQFFCFAFAFAVFTSGFALYAERTFVWHGQPFTPREIGFIFAYSGLLGIILQGGLIGRLAKRFGDPALVAAGFAAAGIAYLLLGLIATIPLLVVAATISTFGNGVVRPCLTSLISQSAGRHEQGVVFGLTQSLVSVAQVVAPILGGFLIEHHHLTAWACGAAVASLVGLVAVRWGSGRASPASPSSSSG